MQPIYLHIASEKQSRALSRERAIERGMLFRRAIARIGKEL
jgi:hypothetical protein